MNLIYFIIFFICIVGTLVFMVKKRRNLFKKLNIVYIFIMVVVCFLFLYLHLNHMYFVRIQVFGSQFESCIAEAHTKNGRMPVSINELKGIQHFSELLRLAFIPYNHQVNLICKSLDDDYFEYKFYTFGFDGDDDDLDPMIEPSFLTELYPFVNGDILIYQGSLKFETIIH